MRDRSLGPLSESDKVGVAFLNITGIMYNSYIQNGDCTGRLLLI